MMQILLSVVVVVFCWSASAEEESEGKCWAKPGQGVHSHLCKGKKEEDCEFFSYCMWKASKVKTISITEDGKKKTIRIIEEEPDKKCLARKDKKHSRSFCKGLSQMACETHSSSCVWE